jgi:hypothetical protein
MQLKLKKIIIIRFIKIQESFFLFNQEIRNDGKAIYAVV